MKLALIYRAGIAYLRPVADTWVIDAGAPEWRDWLLAVAFIATVVAGALIAPRAL